MEAATAAQPPQGHVDRKASAHKKSGRLVKNLNLKPLHSRIKHYPIYRLKTVHWFPCANDCFKFDPGMRGVCGGRRAAAPLPRQGGLEEGWRARRGLGGVGREAGSNYVGLTCSGGGAAGVDSSRAGPDRPAGEAGTAPQGEPVCRQRGRGHCQVQAGRKGGARRSAGRGGGWEGRRRLLLPPPRCIGRGTRERVARGGVRLMACAGGCITRIE